MFVGYEYVVRDINIAIKLINRLKTDYYNSEYFDYIDFYGTHCLVIFMDYFEDIITQDKIDNDDLRNDLKRSGYDKSGYFVDVDATYKAYAKARQARFEHGEHGG